MNGPNKPESMRVSRHVLLLCAGVAVMLYLCFAPDYLGIPVNFRARMVAVVLGILVFGSYLRRFGRSP
jgi:hypothetical protein